MMYILIIFAFSGAQGVAVTTAELVGESNCKAAAQQVNSMSKSFSALCVKRGQ